MTVLAVDPTTDPQVHDLAGVADLPPTPSRGPGALVTERLAADDGLVVGTP